MAVTQAVSVVTGNQGARVFHLMMIIPAGILLLILSLTSLGTMATTNNKFKDVLDDLGKDGNCILFTKAKNNDFDPNKDSQCNFVVWGDAILAILAVMFSVVLGLKAALNVAVMSVYSLVELALLIFGTVWAFIVGVVITAGLDETCQSFRDANPAYSKNVPCCAFYFGLSQNKGLYFYEELNTSKITAWVAMALLFCLSAMYILILVVACCQRGRQSISINASAPVDVDDPDPDPVKEMSSFHK